MPAAGESSFCLLFGAPKSKASSGDATPDLRTSTARSQTIKSKTGGSRPARRLTFFSAKKVSKNACFYFCHEGLWPFSTSCPNRPPFLRDHKKSIVPGLAALARPVCSEVPQRKRPSWHNRSRRGRDGAARPIERFAARWDAFPAGPEHRRYLVGPSLASTHRTFATAMPAAGIRPFSASSFGPAKEDGVVRGRNPGSTFIRPQGRKQNQKQNRRVAPRQAPYFFQREKSKQKRWALWQSPRPVGLFNAAAKQAGIFFAAAEKASFPGSLRSHGPNGSELPRRKRLFDTGTSPLRLRRCNLAQRAACRSLGSFSC
ncbi:hypothetical protein EDC39_107130 [Geothermobacter ehrlichii]|uniref:Uncharacterized protein n=1 Tax=Geothermobacter ehrlichii TaxID=213224 RepID=A0A5D3WHK4_9BACT|nr:hypothetical protein EDC39_107130 [Geothermobacter ehrlichii]